MVVPFWTPITPLTGFLLHADPHEPIGLNTQPVFLLQFGTQLLEKLNKALIHELLVGEEAS